MNRKEPILQIFIFLSAAFPSLSFYSYRTVYFALEASSMLHGDLIVITIQLMNKKKSKFIPFIVNYTITRRYFYLKQKAPYPTWIEEFF